MSARPDRSPAERPIPVAVTSIVTSVVSTDAARILILEDDPDLRGVVSDILRDAGFEVLEADDSAHALEACASFDPALLIVDLRLPGGLDGAAFLDAYRRRYRTPAKVLVISGRVDGAETAARARADGYLSKPFAVDDVLSAVNRLITRV